MRAILHLKKLEAEARERGHWVSPDDAIDEAYEELFGKAEMGFVSSYYEIVCCILPNWK